MINQHTFFLKKRPKVRHFIVYGSFCVVSTGKNKINIYIFNIVVNSLITFPLTRANREFSSYNGVGRNPKEKHKTNLSKDGSFRYSLATEAFSFFLAVFFLFFCNPLFFVRKFGHPDLYLYPVCISVC